MSKLNFWSKIRILALCDGLSSEFEKRAQIPIEVYSVDGPLEE